MNKNWTLYGGVFAAVFSVGLVGCGGNKKSNKFNTAVAPATSGTAGTNSGTAGTNSGTAGTSSGTTPGSTPGTPGTPGTPADDHGDTAQTATAVQFGTPTGGIIEVAGDVDWFAVDLVSGTDYTIKTQNLTNGMDTVLGLFDDQGNQLAVNDDVSQNDLSSSVDINPPADGTYFFAVIHASQTGTGDYEVLADLQGAAPPPPSGDDHGNDAQNATALTLATPQGGLIEVGGDIDFFAVDLTSGTDYTFLTQALANGMDTVLGLFDDQGNQLAINDDVSPNDLSSRLDFNAPADATFYLAVIHADPAATGGYEILADVVAAPPPPAADDHANDAGAATVITLATPMTGIIETQTDQDWFQLDLVAGTEYEFRATGTSPGMDTGLTLIDSDGTTMLDANDDTNVNPGSLDSRVPNDAATNFVAPASGTYYLSVEHVVALAQPETYEVIAEEVVVTPPPPANAADLVSAELVDVDGSYAASAGDTITLTFSEDVQFAAVQGSTVDPAAEVELAVAGDSYGQGASIAAGPGATEITITLGTDPQLRLTGSFDPAALMINSPSGLSVAQATVITTLSSGLTATGGAMDIASALTAGFQPAATLNTARGVHTATLLDDGRVLVVGGLTDGPAYVAENEIHDAGTWTNTSDAALGGNLGYMLAGNGSGGAFAIARFEHTATKLANGEVLIAGGFGYERLDANGAAVQEDLSSGFVFDPATNEFTPAASTLAVPRSAHYATLLPNGQVLISGGYNRGLYSGQGGSLPVAELYDPFSRAFAPISATGDDMVFPREAGTAHVVGGKVLHVGGHLFAATQANPTVALYMAPGSEGFDMAGGAFAQDADLVENRRFHTASVLSTGDLLIMGGDNGSGATATVELYDATAGTFASVGSLQTARMRLQSAMVGDDVLAIGGVATDPATGSLADVATGELYNTQFNIVEVYQMQSPRNSHTAVTMPNGSVMVVGGFSGGTSLMGLNGVAVGGAEVFVLP